MNDAVLGGLVVALLLTGALLVGLILLMRFIDDEGDDS